MDAEPHATRTLNPAQLQVLGRHPLRLRILDELQVSGPATATQLAARTGGNSGTTSYHLRQLAAAGIVDEVPQLRHGKERWWRLPPGGLNFSHPGREAETAAASVFAGMFMHEQDMADADRMEAFVAQLAAGDDPRAQAWLGTVIAHRNVLFLTPAELRELGEALVEFMRPWFEASARNEAAAAHLSPGHSAESGSTQPAAADSGSTQPPAAEPRSAKPTAADAAPEARAETVIFAARAFPVLDGPPPRPQVP